MRMTFLYKILKDCLQMKQKLWKIKTKIENGWRGIIEKTIYFNKGKWNANDFGVGKINKKSRL